MAILAQFLAVRARPVRRRLPQRSGAAHNGCTVMTRSNLRTSRLISAYLRSIGTACLISLGALAAVGCGHAAVVPEANARMAEDAKATWPDASLAELTLGRSEFLEHCGTCHSLPAPADKPAERWSGIVQRMVETHHAKLEPAEQQAVTRYLSSAAKK